MSNIDQIIADLNVTIADTETIQVRDRSNAELSRALGQLKAARASLVRLADASFVTKEVKQ